MNQELGWCNQSHLWVIENEPYLSTYGTPREVGRGL
jgi:hypothetical protein